MTCEYEKIIAIYFKPSIGNVAVVNLRCVVNFSLTTHLFKIMHIEMLMEDAKSFAVCVCTLDAYMFSQEHIIHVWEEAGSEFHNCLIQLYCEKVQGLMKEYLRSFPPGIYTHSPKIFGNYVLVSMTPFKMSQARPLHGKVVSSILPLVGRVFLG